MIKLTKIIAAIVAICTLSACAPMTSDSSMAQQVACYRGDHTVWAANLYGLQLNNHCVEI